MYIENFHGFCSHLNLIRDTEEAQGRRLKDGIYAVAETIQVFNGISNPDANDLEEITNFIQAHPAWVFAGAYETYTWMLLSEPPTRLSMNDHVKGTGFNYGVTALVENCPSRLLILAEND